MSDLRRILERQMADIEVPALTLEGFHRRRRRVQRTRRVGTALVSLLIVVTAFAGLLRMISSDPVDSRVASQWMDDIQYVVEDDASDDQTDPSTPVPAEQMASIAAMVDAINARDTDAFLGTFAPESAFAPRGDFRESSMPFGHHLPVADADLVRSFLAIVDAWGLEAEIISCSVLPLLSTYSDDVDAVVECAVATRWHTLSMEITEGWQFELRGAELRWWNSISCCRNDLDLLDLDPSDRTLPLGYDGLVAWEAWLQANRPGDAERFLNPREEIRVCDGCEDAVASLAPADAERAARLAPLVFNAQNDWTIAGHDFAPTGLIPYDPALADEIEASIQEYLDT